MEKDNRLNNIEDDALTGVVFFHGEKPMNKCMNCEHADRVNEKIIYCSYFRCVKEDGWIADKQREVADEKNNQTTNQSDKQTI